MISRTFGFILAVVAGVLLQRNQIYRVWLLLVGSGAGSELYSHIPAIPFISGFFFWLERRGILKTVRMSLGPGLVVMVAALAIWAIGVTAKEEYIRANLASWAMLSLVVWIMGSFILFYGPQAFRKALFPLGFLGFIVPIPSFILDPFINMLLVGSAEASNYTFKLLGVPVLRKGMVFDLPGLTIEVARQCSGVRSSLAFIMFALICAHLFLRRNLSKVLLLTSVIPMTIIKNGFRIVTLGLLGAYVDKVYLTNHWLHRSGGIVFFVAVILTIFVPTIWALKYVESVRLKRNEGRAREGD